MGIQVNRDSLYQITMITEDLYLSQCIYRLGSGTMFFEDQLRSERYIFILLKSGMLFVSWNKLEHGRIC